MAETTSTTNPTLPKEVFGMDVQNHELLKLAYDSYLANGRKSSASTLKRGEVRGGGKKPWQQKGTGRARFGSSRNPIWRGGGIAFGPSGNENYTMKLSKTAKRTAIRQALSVANQSNLIVIDEIKTTGKTSEVAKYLKDNKLESKKVLLVVDEKSPELLRATRNIQNVLLVRTPYLNVYRILNADTIIFAKSAIATAKTWLVKEEA